MRVYTTWRRLKSDTINGDGLMVTTIYTSYDKTEIDALEEKAKEQVGTGLIYEAKTEPGG